MQHEAQMAEGELLAGKYRVERVIGEGGMGRVLAAWHIGLAQRVAIKLLHKNLAEQDRTAIERFKREAHTAARIRHEHVCRVLDAGTLEGGTPYLAMEYLEGRDLGAELSHRGRLEALEAVTYVRQACEGVHEAHRLGIVHRDLKPQNLFLASMESTSQPDGQPPERGGERAIKVVDFGISKTRTDGSSSPYAALTKTSALVGSPLYMSPEQLHADKDVDARADVWALGCILYELLTGRPPFTGETMPQLVNAVLYGEPPSFASLGITAPAGLEAVVRGALKKARDERFPSAAALSEALGPYAPSAATRASGTMKVRTPNFIAPLTASLRSHASTTGTDSGAGAPGSSAGSSTGAPGITPSSKSLPGGIAGGSGAGGGGKTPRSMSAAGSGARVPAPQRARHALWWAVAGFLSVFAAFVLAWLTHAPDAAPAPPQTAHSEAPAPVADTQISGAASAASTPEDAPAVTAGETAAAGAALFDAGLADAATGARSQAANGLPSALSADPGAKLGARPRERDKRAGEPARESAQEPAKEPSDREKPPAASGDSLPSFGGRR